MVKSIKKLLVIQWLRATNHERRTTKFVTWFVLVCFSLTTIFPPTILAQTVTPVPSPLLGLPQPGVMVNPTANFVPVILKGVKVYADNPLRFDFIVDSGDSKLEGENLKGESEKLIKYFLASLTTPEEDLWVNLSPYEKDRIIPDKFGTTEMGRDLLAQDYLLKQLTASLMYPEDDLGKEFWDRIYKKAFELYQTTNIPINTFNKVWIVPEKAVVYETKDTAFVVESHLKVMLEGDYLALKENLHKEEIGTDKLADTDVKQLSDVSSGIVRDVIIPAIEKEVNEGKNFSQLRQIYHALILSVWYKKRLRESLLGRVYVDKNKVAGVDVEDKEVRQKIYNQYLEAFKKGVYDYIKNDYDPYINRTLSRQYFSGGVAWNEVSAVVNPEWLDTPGESANLNSSFRSSPTNIVTQVGRFSPRTDIGIASVGEVKDHEEYNLKVTKDGTVLEERFVKVLAGFLGIELKKFPKLQTTIDGKRFNDWDFGKVINRLVDKKHSSVREDKGGNIIVTITAGKEYLVLTTKVDPITSERELLMITPEFGGDHAGRTRNQTFSTTIVVNMEELTELRLWKKLERALINGTDGFSIQIDPDPNSPLPHTIGEWTRKNISIAAVYDKYFHMVGQDRQGAARQLIGKGYSFNKDGFVGLDQLIDDVVDGVNLEDLLIEKELPNYRPTKPVSFNEMLKAFNANARDRVKLKEKPTKQQLVSLQKSLNVEDTLYTVRIFQRKSTEGTGEWFAVKIPSINNDFDPINRLHFALAVAGDIGFSYEVVSPVADDFKEQKGDFSLPPSAEDLVSLVRTSGAKARIHANDDYVYLCSAKGVSLTTRSIEQLESEMNQEWKRIVDEVGKEYQDLIDRQNPIDLPKILPKKLKEANNSVFYRWVEYVHALGFILFRNSQDKFLEKAEAEINSFFRDDTPLSPKPEEVTISSGADESAAAMAAENAAQKSYLPAEMPGNENKISLTKRDLDNFQKFLAELTDRLNTHGNIIINTWSKISKEPDLGQFLGSTINKAAEFLGQAITNATLEKGPPLQRMFLMSITGEEGLNPFNLRRRASRLDVKEFNDSQEFPEIEKIVREIEELLALINNLKQVQVIDGLTIREVKVRGKNIQFLDLLGIKEKLAAASKPAVAKPVIEEPVAEKPVTEKIVPKKTLPGEFSQFKRFLKSFLVECSNVENQLTVHWPQAKESIGRPELSEHIRLVWEAAAIMMRLLNRASHRQLYINPGTVGDKLLNTLTNTENFGAVFRSQKIIELLDQGFNPEMITELDENINELLNIISLVKRLGNTEKIEDLTIKAIKVGDEDPFEIIELNRLPEIKTVGTMEVTPAPLEELDFKALLNSIPTREAIENMPGRIVVLDVAHGDYQKFKNPLDTTIANFLSLRNILRTNREALLQKVNDLDAAAPELSEINGAGKRIRAQIEKYEKLVALDSLAEKFFNSLTREGPLLLFNVRRRALVLEKLIEEQNMTPEIVIRIGDVITDILYIFSLLERFKKVTSEKDLVFKQIDIDGKLVEFLDVSAISGKAGDQVELAQVEIEKQSPRQAKFFDSLTDFPYANALKGALKGLERNVIQGGKLESLTPNARKLVEVIQKLRPEFLKQNVLEDSVIASVGGLTLNFGYYQAGRVAQFFTDHINILVNLGDFADVLLTVYDGQQIYHWDAMTDQWVEGTKITDPEARVSAADLYLHKPVENFMRRVSRRYWGQKSVRIENIYVDAIRTPYKADKSSGEITLGDFKRGLPKTSGPTYACLKEHMILIDDTRGGYKRYSGVGVNKPGGDVRVYVPVTPDIVDLYDGWGLLASFSLKDPQVKAMRQDIYLDTLILGIVAQNTTGQVEMMGSLAEPRTGIVNIGTTQKIRFPPSLPLEVRTPGEPGSSILGRYAWESRKKVIMGKSTDDWRYQLEIFLFGENLVAITGIGGFINSDLPIILFYGDDLDIMSFLGDIDEIYKSQGGAVDPRLKKAIKGGGKARLPDNSNTYHVTELMMHTIPFPLERKWLNRQVVVVTSDAEFTQKVSALVEQSPFKSSGRLPQVGFGVPEKVRQIANDVMMGNLSESSLQFLQDEELRKQFVEFINTFPVTTRQKWQSRLYRLEAYQLKHVQDQLEFDLTQQGMRESELRKLAEEKTQEMTALFTDMANQVKCSACQWQRPDYPMDEAAIKLHGDHVNSCGVAEQKNGLAASQAALTVVDQNEFRWRANADLLISQGGSLTVDELRKNQEALARQFVQKRMATVKKGDMWWVSFWGNLIDMIIDDEDYRTEVMRNSKVKFADNYPDIQAIFQTRIKADFWRRFHQDILFKEETVDAKNMELERQKIEDELKDARLNGQTDEVKRLERELLPFIAKDDLAIEIRKQLSEIESGIDRILTANPNNAVANEQLRPAAMWADDGKFFRMSSGKITMEEAEKAAEVSWQEFLDRVEYYRLQQKTDQQLGEDIHVDFDVAKPLNYSEVGEQPMLSLKDADGTILSSAVILPFMQGITIGLRLIQKHGGNGFGKNLMEWSLEKMRFVYTGRGATDTLSSDFIEMMAQLVAKGYTVSKTSTLTTGNNLGRVDNSQKIYFHCVIEKNDLTKGPFNNKDRNMPPALRLQRLQELGMIYGKIEMMPDGLSRFNQVLENMNQEMRMEINSLEADGVVEYKLIHGSLSALNPGNVVRYKGKKYLYMIHGDHPMLLPWDDGELAPVDLSKLDLEVLGIKQPSSNFSTQFIDQINEAAAKGVENDHQRKPIPEQSWRPKFTYSRLLADEKFRRFDIKKVLGINPSLPADFPFVQVTEKGLVFPENQRIVYKSEKLAKKLSDLGIKFLMGGALTSRKFLDHLRNREDGDLRQFMKEEGVYEIVFPEKKGQEWEHLVPYANEVLGDLFLGLEDKYPKIVDLFRTIVLESLSHVPQSEIEKNSKYNLHGIRNTVLLLQSAERTQGEHFGYKPIVFFALRNNLINNILLRSPDNSKIIMPLIKPFISELSWDMGQEVVSYFLEQLEYHSQVIKNPEAVGILLNFGMRLLFDSKINPKVSSIDSPYKSSAWREDIQQSFNDIDDIFQTNSFFLGLLNLLKQKGIFLDEKFYNLREVTLLAEEGAEVSGKNPIFKMILQGTEEEEETILVKWVGLKEAHYDRIATRTCDLLGVPYYHVQADDFSKGSGVWELIEYHSSDEVAFTYEDMLNPRGVFLTPGINAALSGDVETVKQRFRTLGGIWAIEYILGARDSKMKHILLRKADGLFFRIDWEYLLDFESPENLRIPTVLKGDERQFLMLLARQGNGKYILQAIWEGFKRTYQQAKERQGEILQLIPNDLLESNNREKLVDRLNKGDRDIAQDLGLVNSGFIETQIGANKEFLPETRNLKGNFDGGIDLEKTKDTVEFKGDGDATIPPVMPADPAAIQEFETLPFSGVTFTILYMGPVPDLSAFVGEMPAEKHPDSAGEPESQSLSKNRSPVFREPDYELAGAR